MNLTKTEERYVKVGIGAGLLFLYFGGFAVNFGGGAVLLTVPYAFLWLMWTLNGIKSQHEKLNENLKRYTPQIPQE